MSTLTFLFQWIICVLAHIPFGPCLSPFHTWASLSYSLRAYVCIFFKNACICFELQLVCVPFVLVYIHFELVCISLCASLSSLCSALKSLCAFLSGLCLQIFLS